MDKEKFRVPMPDERTIQAEIQNIVSAAATRQAKESFLEYLQALYRHIGIRHIFSDRSELAFILMIAFTLLGFAHFGPKPDRAHDVYSFLFVISPILFLACSIFTYFNKMMHRTYEVEMACKFNVYQATAFRMLAFSVVSVLVNTIGILFIVNGYPEIHFLRAFMISITALFVFSILFLYVMIRRCSVPALLATVAAWIAGNVILRFAGNMLYFDILLGLPLIVYAIVLAISLYCYLRYINKLIRLNHAKGA
ncbi:hypothetical protein PAE9249_01154 [Paenibacillus sp. CECT 9249]|uniref:hypothetical protein n=1 Tax=Paenibacillus sp. CECT 9249 TaxID=2845385 RepID=UPI001E28340C|nr:hypothetical protein [Paenibacillus sp. CECT 9249]CAH0118662.1 hypothetical protein PAE9249_01154 [Paenibacillus sp. CECT 9249]